MNEELLDVKYDQCSLTYGECSCAQFHPFLPLWHTIQYCHVGAYTRAYTRTYLQPTRRYSIPVATYI